MDNQQAKIYLGKEIARRLVRMPGSNAQIATDLCVSVTTVGNVLNGYYERHSIRMYMKLATQLRVEINIEVVE